MIRTRTGIVKLFWDTFGAPLPDARFNTMWQSCTSEQIQTAMQKAKTWLRDHNGKTPLDAARIISSLLREARTIERRRKEVDEKEGINGTE
jgi:hypothetical protein